MAPIRFRSSRRSSPIQRAHPPNASNGSPMQPNTELVKEEPMDPVVDQQQHHKAPSGPWNESLQQLVEQLEASRLKEAEAVKRVEEQLLNIQWRLDRLQQQIERRPSPPNSTISPASSFTSGPHPPFHPHLPPHPHQFHPHPHHQPHHHQEYSASDESLPSDSSWPRPPPLPLFHPMQQRLSVPRREVRMEPYPRQAARKQQQQPQLQMVKGVRCGKCGKAGHYTKNCWIKVVKKCSVCHRPGHYNWECRNAKTAAGQRFVDALTMQQQRP